jgi:hypothetical protein
MSYHRPPPGSMVLWRFSKEEKAYMFGYVTYVSSYNMIRMGLWNGDSNHGPVVDIADIDWKEYR